MKNGSVRSWFRKVNLGLSMCSMFWSEPVSRLSRQITRWPLASRWSHRCEPRNPAPPVTMQVLMGAAEHSAAVGRIWPVGHHPPPLAGRAQAAAGFTRGCGPIQPSPLAVPSQAATRSGASVRPLMIKGGTPGSPGAQGTWWASVPRLGLAVGDRGVGVLGEQVEVGLVGGARGAPAVAVDRRVGDEVAGRRARRFRSSPSSRRRPLPRSGCRWPSRRSARRSPPRR